jgi:hypothetical protein
VLRFNPLVVVVPNLPVYTLAAKTVAIPSISQIQTHRVAEPFLCKKPMTRLVPPGPLVPNQAIDRFRLHQTENRYAQPRTQIMNQRPHTASSLYVGTGAIVSQEARITQLFSKDRVREAGGL